MPALSIGEGNDLISQKSRSFPLKGEKSTWPRTCSCALLNAGGDGTLSSVEGYHQITFSPRHGGIHVRRK